MGRRALTAIVAAIIVLGCGASAASAPGSLPAAPRLPTSVGSTPLYLHTANPGYYASPPPGDPWVGILGAVGKKWSDLVWVGASTDGADGSTLKVNVTAREVRNATGPQLLAAYQDWMARGAASAWTTERTTIEGRTTLRATLAGDPHVLVIYASGNTLFEIAAADEATAETVLATLP